MRWRLPGRSVRRLTAERQSAWYDAALRSVSAGRQVAAQRRRSPDRDSVTGLPNYRELYRCLEERVAGGEAAALLFLDLERFRVVNDTLGYEAGDGLLRQLAVRLETAKRTGDLVAHLGADEFGIVTSAASEEAAVRLATELLAVVRLPHLLTDGPPLVMTASVGVRVLHSHDSVEAVIRDADTATYAAKRSGGDRVQLFQLSLREAAIRAHRLEVALRAALRRDELDLAYQPIVSAKGGVRGAEALLRWPGAPEDAEPAELIAIAEQSDLIVEVGEWVLRRAVRDAAAWPGLELAVNVSPVQIAHEGFEALLRDVVEQGTVPARLLCLEITETAVVGDIGELVSQLTRIGEMDIRVSLDDFGTGHASLTYLAQLPVHVVKIDRSFVADTPRDRGARAIVESVVAMARAFSREVVAEGVETATQWNYLASHGCDLLQGFLIARPMSALELTAFLAQQPQRSIPAPRPCVAQAPRQIDEESSAWMA